jgi:hypothetical protein
MSWKHAMGESVFSLLSCHGHVSGCLGSTNESETKGVFLMHEPVYFSTTDILLTGSYKIGFISCVSLLATRSVFHHSTETYSALREIAHIVDSVVEVLGLLYIV